MIEELGLHIINKLHDHHANLEGDILSKKTFALAKGNNNIFRKIEKLICVRSPFYFNFKKKIFSCDEQ